MATAKEVLQDKFSKWGVVCSLDGDITLSSKRGLNALDIIEVMQEYATSLHRFNWQTTKPEFKEECLLITASKWKHGWEYTSWQIKWTECDGASYMGWFTGENEEYGDLADLNAEMYLVLPLLK